MEVEGEGGMGEERREREGWEEREGKEGRERERGLRDG